MKIWYERAGDHSANLKIVGSFKTDDDAQQVVERVNGLLSVLKGTLTDSPHGPFAEEVLDYITKTNFSISPEAVESCQFYNPIERDGNSIEIRTDEVAIQIFIESFVRFGGRIEIYSLHNYPE